MQQNPRPLFVLGCPRSGTTLLAELLAASVYGKPTETQFFTKYARRLDRYGDLSQEANFCALAEHVLNERAVMQWKLGLTPEELWETAPSHDYVGLIEGLMRERSRRRGWQNWGDKTPHYTLDLDVLTRLWPESRYLFITRDGRDVALSLLGRRWGPNNVYRCAQYWASYHQAFEDLTALERSGQLFKLRYEDLLENPMEWTRKIYEFLEDPKSDAELAALTADVKGGNKEKWRKKMSAAQIERFERAAADALKREGYPVSHEQGGVSALGRGYWQLHDRALGAWELFRSNTIDAIRIRFFGAEPFAE